MADGWIAGHAVRHVRRTGRLIAFLLMLLPASWAVAETLAGINERALAAWSAGDSAAATALVEKGVAIARAPGGQADLAAWSTALTNAAFLRSQAGAADEAETLWREVIAAQDAAASGSPEAVLARLQLANHLQQQARDPTVALQLLKDALPMARGGRWHGQAAKLLADAELAGGNYVAFALAFDEALANAPDLIRTVYGDYYSRLGQEVARLEDAGRWPDVPPLIESQLTILRSFYTLDNRDQAIRNLMYNRYFALLQMGETERARTQLLAWKSFGTLSDEDIAFIRGQIEAALPLADGGNINTLERLETVRNAVFFASAFEDANPRLGLAMRTLASAEGYFGQNAAAVKTLETGAAIMERSTEGRRHVFLLYDDLAWNLALIGEDARADLTYAWSDAARVAALAEGPDTESATDRAWRHMNRAIYYRWSGRPEQAQAEIRVARDALGPEPGQADFAWHLVQTRIADVALAAGETTDPAALIAAVDALRAVAPAESPDFSMALSNAGDTLMVAGQHGAARALLAEAVAVNRTALPDTVPQVLTTLGLLARVDMMQGDRDSALAGFREIVAARKSPVYRDTLAEAAPDFEQLAWLLIDRPDPSPKAVAEAFEALQWTQVTRSAEAAALLEARLAVDDPALGALLRQRQDLTEAHAGLAARLSRVRDVGGDVTDLTEEIETVAVELAGVDTRLDALGLDSIGLGAIQPLPLTDVQALLRPDEMLVTFLLPGLTPGRIEGLVASSNLVIGVTSDKVRIARMGEASRRELNRRIQQFRCEMAQSDPGCGTFQSQGSRGAMAASGSKPKAEEHFDLDFAHALFTDLFGDLARDLAAYPHLIIAPPPDLLRLPFAALPTATEREVELAQVRWLIRDHSISLLPAIYSLRSLREGQPSTRRLERMAGFGDPVLGIAAPVRCGDIPVAALRAAPSDGLRLSPAEPGAVPLANVDWLATLPALPDTVCELQAIAGAFGGKSELFLGDSATETQVKAMDRAGQLRALDLMIFATHGLTAGEAGAASPGLVLTPPPTATLEDDGLLTAGEIAQLDIDAQLVVLSACNTAAGEDTGKDGLSGLARAFFQAGARNLLVTHWSVYSEAAEDLTTGLFLALESDPQLRFSEALRLSVLRVLDERNRPALHHHPAYWAAFTIVGAE